MHGQHELLRVARAQDALGLALGLRQRGQEHARRIAMIAIDQQFDGKPRRCQHPRQMGDSVYANG
jgi:hypothetical protein